MSRLKQLGKDSVIYGVGGIVAKGITFFLLPVYTRIFSPADYGAIEMLTVVAALLSAVMVMGMDSAQSMFFFKEKEGGKAAQARIVSAILQWRLCWGAAVVLIATLVSPVINAQLFAGKLRWEFFAVAFGGALITQVMSQSIEVLRLMYRPWPYVLITLAQSVLAAISILLAVLVFDQGVLGYFLGAMVAAAVAALIGWVSVREYLDFSGIHSQAWPRLLKFGAPLLVSDLAYYIMSTTDRWFVQQYHGEAVLGVYAIGAKFAMLMALAVETFRKAWWPIAMDAMHSADGPETYRMIARLFIGLGAAGVVGLTLFSPWLVRWLVAPEFHSAWPIVGVLAWQSVFYGFFLIAAAGIWKAEKTYLSTYLMGGAALLNVVLNYLLVPRYGGMGAALATVLTYFVWVVASMALSEGLWRVGFPIGVMAVQIAVGGLLVFWLIVIRHGVFGWVDTLAAAAGILLLCGIAVDRAARRTIHTRLVALWGR